MPVNGPREKLAADLELLKPVAGHVAYWSCGLIAGQSLTLGDLRALLAEPPSTPSEVDAGSLARTIAIMLNVQGEIEISEIEGPRVTKQGVALIQDLVECAMRSAAHYAVANTPAPIPDIAIPISDALRQVEAALRDLVTANSDCACAPFWEPYGKTDPTCAYHELQTEVDAARAALALLPAIAQQMVEGEQRRVFLIDLQRRLDAVAPLIEQQRDDLVRTREALAVAEGALQHAPCKCFGFGLSSDFYECSRCSALARIAALSPTGTPGAEGEPTI